MPTALHEPHEEAAERTRQVRPLRVLVINEFFYPENMGGSGTSTSDRVAGLVGLGGAEVTAITSQYAYRDPAVRYPARETWGGVQIHRVKSPNWGREQKLTKRLVGNFLFSMMAAMKAVAIPKPDVVMLTTAPATCPIAGLLIKKLRRVPYVYLIFDLDPDRTVALGFKTEGSHGVRVLKGMQRKWLYQAERVVVLGRCMRDHLVRQYGISHDRVVVVESVASGAVTPVPKQTQFRSSHNLSGTVVLYSGNFGRYHDFDTLLHTAAALQEDRPDITFVLVGGGAKKQYVEQFVDREGLRNVRIFPFVPEEELTDLMGSADVHVVTLDARMEGLSVPGKFYTCLASGRPVIAIMSAGTEVAKVIDDADLGYHVQVGDVLALVKILAEADAEKLAEKGRRARELYARLYTNDLLTEKLLRVLSESAKAGG